MTIEATLERIADALEILAGSGAPEQTPKPEPEKSKASKPKTSKAKAKEEAAPAETPAETLSIGAVREALKSLQKATDAATAKGVLESFGASTLSALDEKDYARVILAAEMAE